MRLLLAVEDDPTLLRLLLSTVAVLSGVIVVLFWQLLKSKDEKLGIALEFGKDFAAEKVATQAASAALAADLRRVAEGLETALGERDKIVRDAMEVLRRIESKLDTLLRERTP